jgi:hypothetical protein
MMYQNKMIACIKANGKVLREIGEKVIVPYGTEYSIFLKNLNNTRAVVQIEIDGEEVVAGGLIIDVNQSIDLERFVSETTLSKGNKFKFIERTEAVENHRGIRPDDGVVRISWHYEIPTVVSTPPLFRSIPSAPQWGDLQKPEHYRYGINDITCSTVSFCDYSAQGITVPGSISDQRFETVSIGRVDPIKHTIVLHLVGGIDEKIAVEPITVAKKIKCPTCGKKNKPTSKFCPQCGTAVTIL